MSLCASVCVDPLILQVYVRKRRFHALPKLSIFEIVIYLYFASPLVFVKFVFTMKQVMVQASIVPPTLLLAGLLL